MTAPPTEDMLSGSSPAAMGGGDAVHVAVGKSVGKTMALLQWSFGMFPGHEIVLLHVHRPSMFIPTPMGKLPANRANPEMVEAFRREEREETMKVLSTYMMACRRSRIKASIATTEADEVQKGIVDLVNLHSIRKLVIGTSPGFMKGKITSCKESHVAEHVPSYCEVWFVNKRKLIWKRTASASPSCELAPPFTHDLIMPWSLNRGQNEFLKSPCNPIHSHSASSSGKDSFGGDEFVAPSVSSVEECLCTQLVELQLEADESKDEAFLRLLERKIMEDEAVVVFNKVKAMEIAYSEEEKLRIDAEETLKITIQEQEKLLDEREKTTQQLQRITRNVALLDSRAHEANRIREEASEELKLIEASILSLRSEKQKVHGQKNKAMKWLDEWKNHDDCEDKEEYRKEEACEVPELSQSDIETATCGFCESLRIGVGDYGAVYRGEISGKTVAVKKFHGYDMEKHEEFYRAVQVLGKLHHPHLVKLIGVSPESLSLVYEYLPGGSLQNYFCNERNISALDWKTRARIVSDIASGLLFLHSFKSKKMVHGNLKPENLFLDSENRCKISDYVDNMLIKSCSGACLYTDPESLTTGSLTHKSDVYSFGVIILQLVTGRTKRRIVSKVRKATSMGKLASILDLSAGDWSTYVARRLVELGLKCCEMNSRDRPELTPSLVRELECVSLLEDLAVPSFFLCPILREIMHDPHVAADGFTYEGDALRGWLGSGRETSPMTNLKLDHLELTPNYSLRLSIQDWVANLDITS